MEHSVALVDDHHLVRTGLAAMVNGLGGYRVTLEVNGRELIEALAKAKEAPIAIVDLNMPVMDGYATIAWLNAHAPTVLPSRHLRCHGRCVVRPYAPGRAASC